MIFQETKLRGVFIIEPESLEDERGFFARTFCQDEFKSRQLEPTIAQCSLSFNRKKGTLRGMHYQIAPYEEAKLVRCTRGGIYDVVLDLRSSSPTFKQWVATQIDEENRKMVYLPKGVAHGFQTLEDNTEVFYQMSEYYHSECARGVRWDDPAFGIEWPPDERILFDRDKKWPLFGERVYSSPSDSRMKLITQGLKTHYSQKFAEFGATPRGVDWGKEEDMHLRYNKMLAVMEQDSFEAQKPITLLDVGCGFGGLYWYIKEKGMDIHYTGIDVSENMIEYATGRISEGRFYCTDILDFQSDERFDYVLCNGILTQKLSASILDMDNYAHELIKKMFSLCRRGVAFNVMTTKVNFMVSNLYYRNPVELFAHCLNEVTRRIRIDHSYPLFEYTVYLYR